jgi:hypothetical protein
MTVYVDKDIQVLSDEIIQLEEDLLNLTEDKLNIENKIYDFNNKYNEKVGPTLLKYLQQREENIKEAIENTDDEEKKENLNKKLNDAKEDTQDYSTYTEDTPNIIELSEEQEQELKALYKKACRLCHPDMVDESFKQEALSIFHQLNEANQKKDIEKVKEILAYLEDNNMSINTNISDIEILKKRHFNLKSDILKIQIEITDLQNDGTYKRIENIQDWDRYFKIVSKQLEKEIYKQEIN